MGIDSHKLCRKFAGSCGSYTKTPFAYLQKNENRAQHHNGNGRTYKRMLGKHYLSAESINDDIGIRPCLCRIIERLKRYEFRIAEHKGSSAEEQRYKTHCDDLLAKLVNIASFAEHQQIDEKADCHAYGHTDKHADIHRYSPIIQTISNNIASKSSYRCLRKISCGGCSENKSHSKGR